MNRGSLRRTYALMLVCLASVVLQAQWVRTIGPYGGMPGPFAVISQGGEVMLFMGTVSQSVYRSTDLGASWSPSSAGLPAGKSLSALAAVDTVLLTGVVESGVYRSTDRGATWALMGLSPLSVTRFADVRDDAGARHLFAASATSGIYYSTDFGQVWTPVYDRVFVWGDSVRVAGVTALVAFQDGAGGTVLLAGSSGDGVYRSTNKGMTWTAGGFNRHVTGLFVSRPLTGDSLVFASASDLIYRSSDYGETWTLVASGWGYDTRNIASLPNDAGGMNYFVAGSGAGVFLSTNSGSTWKVKSNGLLNLDLGALLSFSDGAGNWVLLAATGTGLFRTNDNGDHWTRISLSPQLVVPRAIAVLPDKDAGDMLFVSAWLNVMYRSSDNGNSWVPIDSGGAPRNVERFAVSPNRMGGMDIFAAPSEGVYRSSDRGATWVPVSDLGLLYPHVGSWAAAGSELYATFPTGLYRFSRNTLSWLPLTSPPEGASSVVAFANNNGGLSLLVMPGFYLSSDEGSSWSQINQGLPFVRAIAVWDKTLFASTSDGVYRTNEAQTGWEPMNDSLTNLDVVRLDVIPDGKGGMNLFALTSSGVFTIGSAGTRWRLTELPGATNLSPMVGSGPYLFSFDGNGVYRRLLSELVTNVETAVGGVPEQFYLEQNYPNPFNPTTTIRYTIGVTPSGTEGSVNPGEREGPVSMNVRLAVYDLLAREVVVLVNEHRAPGSYQVNFDGSRLASGTYFCRMVAGSFVQTRRLLLLR